MASPVTVADLVSWLGTRLQTWVPSLADIQPWAFLVRLWELVVPGGDPAGDPPWEIEVDGEVEVIGGFELQNIKVVVKSRTPSGVVH